MTEAKIDLSIPSMPFATFKVLMQLAHERNHAVSHEGRKPADDDRLVGKELVYAAFACASVSDDLLDRYLTASNPNGTTLWPFDTPLRDKGYRQNLIRAMQFLCAEVERIDRADTKELARSIARAGMAGAPPLHDSHPDAICVAVNPHVYECPACHARGEALAEPCKP